MAPSATDLAPYQELSRIIPPSPDTDPTGPSLHAAPERDLRIPSPSETPPSDRSPSLPIGTAWRRGCAVLAALAFSACLGKEGYGALPHAGAQLERPAIGPVPQQAQTTTPELRARALVREFPWITRFWAELRGEERARAERAFRRRGQSGGFDTDWDRMGLQDRVLLLFGPGRAGPG